MKPLSLSDVERLREERKRLEAEKEKLEMEKRLVDSALRLSLKKAIPQADAGT